jgi:hypothetical protein
VAEVITTELPLWRQNAQNTALCVSQRVAVITYVTTAFGKRVVPIINTIKLVAISRILIRDNQPGPILDFFHVGTGQTYSSLLLKAELITHSFVRHIELVRGPG